MADTTVENWPSERVVEVYNDVFDATAEIIPNDRDVPSVRYNVTDSDSQTVEGWYIDVRANADTERKKSKATLDKFEDAVSDRPDIRLVDE